MILNEEQIKGIKDKDGIEQGFVNEGYPFGTRDKMIVDLAVRTTLGFLEKTLETSEVVEDELTEASKVEAESEEYETEQEEYRVVEKKLREISETKELSWFYRWVGKYFD